MDGILTDEVVQQVRRGLTDTGRREQMMGHSYRVAQQYFSYDRVGTELRAILAKPARAVHALSG